MVAECSVFRFNANNRFRVRSAAGKGPVDSGFFLRYDKNMRSQPLPSPGGGAAFAEDCGMNGTKEQTVSRRGGAKKYFHDLFDLRGDMMSYEALDEMMEENTHIYGSNMWILIMAILIASIGLNVNSTAVIIGAMLVSPLMSGILTMGYSLAICDLTMLRRAAARFGTQVVISLITSTIYFSLTPLAAPTSEMIARTTPTIWDVLIALFGGLAGGIGNTREKKGNVIPGVAIATALMPPLCTAGYGIATMQLRFLLGAFYLFSINTLFIALSAAAVTKLLRVPSRSSLSEKEHRKLHRVVRTIAVVTVIPSIILGAVTVYSSVVDSSISRFLSRELVFADTQVVQSSTDKMERKISVSLVGMPVSDEKIAQLQERLTDYGLEDYSLHVVQNRSLEGETDTDKLTIAVQESTIRQLEEALQKQEERILELEAQSAAGTDWAKLASDAAEIFPWLSDCACGLMRDGAGEYALLTAEASRAVTAEEQQTLEAWLRTASGLDRAVVLLG